MLLLQVLSVMHIQSAAVLGLALATNADAKLLRGASKQTESELPEAMGKHLRIQIGTKALKTKSGRHLQVVSTKPVVPADPLGSSYNLNLTSSDYLANVTIGTQNFTTM